MVNSRIVGAALAVAIPKNRGGKGPSRNIQAEFIVFFGAAWSSCPTTFQMRAGGIQQPYRSAVEASQRFDSGQCRIQHTIVTPESCMAFVKIQEISQGGPFVHCLHGR